MTVKLSSPSQFDFVQNDADHERTSEEKDDTLDEETDQRGFGSDHRKEREPLLFPVSIILQYLQNINLHEMEKQKIRWLTYIAVLELQDSLGFLSLSPGVEDDSDKASAKTSQS